MQPFTEYDLHLETTRTGDPLRAYLLGVDTAGNRSWLADTEFGPFDTLHDVSRFLLRGIRYPDPVRQW